MLCCFEDAAASSFFGSTKSRDEENSGLSRVRRLIVVGPEGLLRAKMPWSGSGGIVDLGMSMVDSKAVLMTLRR